MEDPTSMPVISATAADVAPATKASVVEVTMAGAGDGDGDGVGDGVGDGSGLDDGDGSGVDGSVGGASVGGGVTEIVTPAAWSNVSALVNVTIPGWANWARLDRSSLPPSPSLSCSP